MPLTDEEKKCKCVTLCAQDGDIDRSRCVLHGTKRGDQYRAQLRKDRYLEHKKKAEDALRAAEKSLLEWAQVTGFYDLRDRHRHVESQTLDFRHWPQDEVNTHAD